MNSLNVLIGHSLNPDTRTAIGEVIDAIAQPDICLTLLFTSPEHDLELLAPILQGQLSGPILGCTTAGEDSALRGHATGSIVAVSVASPHLIAHPHVITPLDSMTQESAKAIAAGLHERRRLPDGECFSLLLIDGMSMLEETTTAFLHANLRVPLVGGSAGDNLQFGKTFVYWEGKFINNAAVVCLVETTLPFTHFRSQHIVPTSDRLVVTEADPTNRRVMEIDGEIASVAYAELLGIAVEDLSPAVFSQHPIMLRLGGEFYVRSIQRVEADGSLVFYCAVDNGIVLTVGEGADLTGNLAETLSEVERAIGPPALVLGCDCILRQLEVEQRGLQARVNEVISRFPYVGFKSYGEQIGGVHVNQTLTGVALGANPA